MKITIEFDTDDPNFNELEMRCQQEGFNLWSCLCDVMQAIRHKRKYGKKFSQEDFEKLERDCLELIRDRGFHLDRDDRP